jgi:hypothetical protein
MTRFSDPQIQSQTHAQTLILKALSRLLHDVVAAFKVR